MKVHRCDQVAIIPQELNYTVYLGKKILTIVKG